MPSRTFEIIKVAILARQQVVADYHGRHREMCPHCVGWKDGKEQALFYQFAGESERGLGPPGSPENWRCVELAGLVNVRVREGPWHTCPSHKRKQTCVDVVAAEVRR